MVAKTGEEFDTILDYQEKAHKNGETDVKLISPPELAELEPELKTTGVWGALYSPDEYVVDPYLLPLSNLYVALHHGCKLTTNCQVEKVHWEEELGMWVVKASDKRYTRVHSKHKLKFTETYSSLMDAASTRRR